MALWRGKMHDDESGGDLTVTLERTAEDGSLTLKVTTEEAKNLREVLRQLLATGES